jgi:hypothetical protein
LTSALDCGEWTASRHDRFTSVPIGQEAWWASEPARTPWRREECIVPVGNRTAGRPARVLYLYPMSGARGSLVG